MNKKDFDLFVNDVLLKVKPIKLRIEIANRVLPLFNRIAELEEQLKNATHKFNIHQEVYYLDYKYNFEPYISKYLTVCKGKVLDIILREEGYVDYNFTLDDLKWIQEENCFSTKEEAEARLRELQNKE